MMNTFVKSGAVSFIACLAISLHCSSSGSKNKNEPSRDLKILGLTVSYPFPLTADNASLVNDTLRVYYYENYVLYDMPNRYVRNGEVIHTRMYFLYEKGEAHGYKIDTLTDDQIDPTKKILRDPYLKEIAYANEHLASTDSLVNVGSIASDELVRKYIMHRRPPPGLTFDTIYLHYTKSLKEFDYSLAPQFDTVSGTKLYNILIAFHLNSFDPAQLTLPASRFIHYELFTPEISLQDKQRIITYIEHQQRVLRDIKSP